MQDTSIFQIFQGIHYQLLLSLVDSPVQRRFGNILPQTPPLTLTLKYMNLHLLCVMAHKKSFFVLYFILVFILFVIRYCVIIFFGLFWALNRISAKFSLLSTLFIRPFCSMHALTDRERHTLHPKKSS